MTASKYGSSGQISNAANPQMSGHHDCFLAAVVVASAIYAW